ncbi:hypothetical protein CVT25_010521 [Psilocybe cyanescens]|uniref:PCI domain-containing protein n=1 Tax=Psilocybe cyanescens TaxID=93625 RepID=A0A409X2L0_PSICY|nr:hypothetical protein CVT25_010521 [Psilocybe cyanescens]
MADEVVLPIPNLTLPEKLFILSSPSLAHLHDEARTALLEGLKADRNITSSPSSPLPLDKALLAEMEAANAAELQKLDERLAEAEKQEGESEISDALKARANYLTRIGDKDKSLAAQQLALKKTPGLGSRIDITLTIVRIGFFFNDNKIITSNMADAEKLIDEGGDWDRRNRLKVYQGLHLISTRQFPRGAELLLDALSTFTASELMSFNDFVALTVIAGALHLGRVDLDKRLIKAPEVNQVLPDLPILGDLVRNLYECHYDKFFIALATLEQTHLLPSRTLSPHARFYTREMRVRAYAQLLESYESLTLESLSAAFGVSVDFVDACVAFLFLLFCFSLTPLLLPLPASLLSPSRLRLLSPPPLFSRSCSSPFGSAHSDLSHFISLSRLACKIDKAHGLVRSTRPSLKNAQYEALVKRGDVLLGGVQRLSKVLY